MQKRNSSVDLLRLIALFGVVGVHFFLHTGFYKIEISGIKVFAANIFRSFFMYCVPLFLMITGFLMNTKTLSKKYYKGILNTYVTYLIASIILILFSNITLNTNYTVVDGLFKILNFSGASYSWYIEMYIGLFLIIPFLNLIYNGLDSKIHKQVLIMTFLMLTTVPLLLNYNEYRNLGWWLFPSSSSNYDKIVPQFWISLYPITYYFIGAYISEFRPKMKRNKNIIFLVMATLFAGSMSYYRSFGSVFNDGMYQSWGAIQFTVIAYLIFILIINVDLKNLSDGSKRLLRMLSNASLGAYLISYMFDKIIYNQLNYHVTNINHKYFWFPIATFLVFSLSLVTAVFLEMIVRKIVKVIFD